MKTGCNHIWEPQGDGSYRCIVCTEVSKTPPPKEIKQALLFPEKKD